METQTTDQPIADQPIPAAAPPTGKEKKPRKKRVTKASLSKQIEKQLLEAAPDVLDAYWLRVKEGLKKGDKHIVELVARLFYGDRGPGSVNIVSNTLNVGNADQGQAARSLESIVRKLEAKDQFKPLPQPTEIRQVQRLGLDVIPKDGVRKDDEMPVLDAEEV